MSDSPILKISGLKAKVADEDLEILRGVDLQINPGEIHAIMGPNGSGKSTLAKALAGHPAYEVTAGTALFHGEDLLEMEPDERARGRRLYGLPVSGRYPGCLDRELHASRQAGTPPRRRRARPVRLPGRTDRTHEPPRDG